MSTVAELEAQLKAAKLAEKQERFRRNNMKRIQFLEQRIHNDTAELIQLLDKSGLPSDYLMDGNVYDA